MMAAIYEVRGFGEVIVNHNSDWSGKVRVLWYEDAEKHEVWIPGPLLKQIAVAAVGDQLSNVIVRAAEQIGDAMQEELSG